MNDDLHTTIKQLTSHNNGVGGTTCALTDHQISEIVEIVSGDRLYDVMQDVFLQGEIGRSSQHDAIREAISEFVSGVPKHPPKQGCGGA